MISIKEAVQKAVEFVKDLPLVEGNNSPTLEEVEFVKGEWKVTLGFRQQKKTVSVLQTFAEPAYDITYKIFSINPEDGKIKSMKLRQNND